MCFSTFFQLALLSQRNNKMKRDEKHREDTHFTFPSRRILLLLPYCFFINCSLLLCYHNTAQIFIFLCIATLELKSITITAGLQDYRHKGVPQLISLLTPQCCLDLLQNDSFFLTPTGKSSSEMIK